MFIIEADTPQEVVDRIALICERNAERCEHEFERAKLQREKLQARAQKIAFTMFANDLKETTVRPKQAKK
jgi:hypothetical protein